MLNPLEKLLIVTELFVLLFRIVIALSYSTKFSLRRIWTVIWHTTSSFRVLIKRNESLFALIMTIDIETSYFSKLKIYESGGNPERRDRDVVKYQVLGYVPSTKVLSLFLFTKFCHWLWGWDGSFFVSDLILTLLSIYLLSIIFVIIFMVSAMCVNGSFKLTKMPSIFRFIHP